MRAKPYAEPLEANLQDLHGRGRDQREGAPPVARGGREKEDGKKRPRGKPCGEDKMVPRAVGMLCEALVAQDVYACSHGFRTGHRQPHARDARREQCRKLPIIGRGDAEVSGWFDHRDGGPLRECSTPRGNEGGILRRIGTWRHAGVREAGERTHPAKGTPPGGVVSPMVSKICLPQVLDAWGVKDVHPRRKGRGVVRRCAEDGLIGGAWEADARRGMAVVPQRGHRCRLTMPPAQTVWRECKRPPSRDPSAGGKGRFAWRGCPHSWAKTRRGSWVSKRQTVRKRRRRCRKGRGTWCREHRHEPWQEPYRT